jgi:hypothetical protein
VNSETIDLGELTALWNDDLPASEQAALSAVAARVSARARLAESLDLAIAVAIAAGVALAIAFRPAPVTIAVGAVAATGLLWTSWNRHRLQGRMREMAGLSGGQELVEREIAMLTTASHRSLMGLIAILPAVLLFALLTHSIQHGGTLAGFGDLMLAGLFDVPVGPAILAAILTLFVQQARLVRRQRRELLALRDVGGQYRAEAALDQAGLS